MLKFATQIVITSCLFNSLCASASAQLEAQFREPMLSTEFAAPDTSSVPETSPPETSPPLAVPHPVQQQQAVQQHQFEQQAFERGGFESHAVQDYGIRDEGFAPQIIEHEVQNQPQYLPQSAFGRASNGLATKGMIWLSVERVFGKYRESNATIGDTRAPQVFNERFMAVNLGALEGEHIGLPELTPGLVGQQITNDDETGTRLRIGYRAINDGGLEFDGLWMDDNEKSWKRGLGSLTSGADSTNVRVTAALPLYDGDAGYAVPYDQFYRIGLTTKTHAYGLHLAPKGKWWGAILLQPSFSVRYLNLSEGLAFAGADSGLTYEHNPDGTPIETTLDPPVSAVPPYQSTLNSIGTTSLIGPMLGLNYATTGKAIRFGGSTRAGLFYADSTQSLSGQGFGNGFGAGFDPSIAFSDSRTSNYATAAFEQNVNVDIDVLRIFPSYRKTKRSSSLVLRLGWSIMAVQRVIRPVESIDWNGLPLTPKVNDSKNEWYLETWNIGAFYQY